MAIPIEANVGVANVEALKQAWHSLSQACAVCTLEKGLASCRAISMVGRVLASNQLEVDAVCINLDQTSAIQSTHSGRKRSFSGRSNMHGF